MATTKTTGRDATLKVLNQARITGKFDELPDITPENINLTLRTLPFEKMNEFYKKLEVYKVDNPAGEVVEWLINRIG